MRWGRIAAALLLNIGLVGCGPAGVVANSVVKATQDESADSLELDIQRRLAANPALTGVKVSVAIGNVWRDAFQTRYAVLLAGTVPHAEARAWAVQAVRDGLRAEPEAVNIADHIRVE